MDGAIFIYANGTNPEVLLVIEARRGRPGADLVVCRSASTRAEPTVRLGLKDVWTHSGKDVPTPDDTYFLRGSPETCRHVTQPGADALEVTAALVILVVPGPPRRARPLF